MGSPEVGFPVGPRVLVPAPVPTVLPPKQSWVQASLLTEAWAWLQPLGLGWVLICTPQAMGTGPRGTSFLFWGMGWLVIPVSLLFCQPVSTSEFWPVYSPVTIQSFSVSAVFMCSLR